jgi:hypothetical protein
MTTNTAEEKEDCGTPSLPSHEILHSRQLRFFTSETSKTLIHHPGLHEDPLARAPPQTPAGPLLPTCLRHTPPLRSQILRSSPSHS